jgi:hypothetical protein
MRAMRQETPKTAKNIGQENRTGCGLGWVLTACAGFNTTAGFRAISEGLMGRLHDTQTRHSGPSNWPHAGHWKGSLGNSAADAGLSTAVSSGFGASTTSLLLCWLNLFAQSLGVSIHHSFSFHPSCSFQSNTLR